MTALCNPFNWKQTARVQPITTLSDASVSAYSQACRNDHELSTVGEIRAQGHEDARRWSWSSHFLM
jgi:hypothetical protein